MLPRSLAAVETAARHGARLIVLPEGTVPAYVLGEEPVDRSQLDRAEEALAKIARAHGAVIVYGTARTVDGVTQNTARVLGPGGVLGHAAKQFLWHFDRRWFARGATLEPIDTPLGKLGVLVCADGRIPTIAATLVERGAEMLVMSTAWVTSGRDPRALENIQADLLVPVRARENGVPFVAANKCGVELQSVAYCGKSSIVAADGTTLARASETREETVHAEVTLGEGAPAARIAPHLSGLGSIETHRTARARARIALTLARDADEVGRFAALAAQADADVLVACGDPPVPPDDVALLAISDASEREAHVVEIAGLHVAIAGDAAFEHPRGLVEARLRGIDCFIWNARGTGEWHARVARSRAAELRAWTIVLGREAERAFACDPDGAIVCGTFGGFRLAAFAYDRARSAATTVAPATDVLEGLRFAESLHGERLAAL